MKALINLVVVFGVVISVCDAAILSNNFYHKSCPKVGERVRNFIWSKVLTNPDLPAKLLRMHFHDCFVRGCDASVLLNATGGTPAERDARPNLTLEGFDVIEDIKSQVESDCSGIVSCSDILSLAARDAVSYAFNKSLWDVPLGRRDGNISLASEVTGNIPSPFSDFATLKRIFANKSLDVVDLVALSGGGHTIGFAHCGTFARRLYNFTGKNDADPSLNTTYADILRTKCPNPVDPAITVEMDPQSGHTFDSHYYDILVQNKGLFQSDAALLNDTFSAKRVEKFRKSSEFFKAFSKSMTKMASIQVLTGNAGEIRKKCGVVNS